MKTHLPRCAGTKVCTRCQVEKHVLEFPANPQHADGLSSWCRWCASEANRSTPASQARLAQSPDESRRRATRKWRTPGGIPD